MNELVVIFVIVVTIALDYLVIYPKVAGNDVRKMVWLDVGLTLTPFIVSALLFWQTDPPFSLIFFDTNWFVYTLVTLAIIEIPVFILYLRARELSREYWASMVSSPTWSGRPARATVERELDDVRWDGLRTRGSKILLLVSSNFVLIADSAPNSDGFSYAISMTWPQVQAVFWLFCGYSLMLPSMAVIWQDLRTRVA